MITDKSVLVNAMRSLYDERHANGVEDVDRNAPVQRDYTALEGSCLSGEEAKKDEQLSRRLREGLDREVQDETAMNGLLTSILEWHRYPWHAAYTPSYCEIEESESDDEGWLDEY